MNVNEVVWLAFEAGVCARPQKWETQAVFCIFDTEQKALCKSELRLEGLPPAFLGETSLA